MAATDILVKSAKGQAEFESKTSSISLKQRSLLVMINGLLREADYVERFKALGDVQGMIKGLEEKGLVERKPGYPTLLKTIDSGAQIVNAEARQYMSEFMYDLMGPEGESLALRLERCRSNRELSEMLDICRETLSNIGKPAKAEELSKAVKNMLA